MTDLILHHYEASPFAEKARLVLGAKGLSWRSVRIPAVMPKPDVIALTGGYRKTPLLQLGNHVYCDTSLIARVIEARHPTPPLLHDPRANVIGQWADGDLFFTAVALSLRPTRFDEIMKLMQPDELLKFRDDRAAMGDGARRRPPPFATAKAQLAVYLRQLEAMLDGHPYLMGDALTIADLSAFHPLFLVDLLCPEHLEGFERVAAWRQRVAMIGHGVSMPLTSAEAIEVCRVAASNATVADESTDNDPSGPAVGTRVRVGPSDMGRDATEGDVVLCRRDEIAVRRHDERAGEVIVHFPRLGYDVIPVSATV